jgi:hypothetical protein
MKRFVLEATWSGYTSSQRRVCHREVLTHGRERFEAISSIRFTDGTYLYVSVRDALPRERIVPLMGYKTVLHGAAYKGLKGSGIPVEAT